jgi:hypothetical protein
VKSYRGCVVDGYQCDELGVMITAATVENQARAWLIFKNSLFKKSTCCFPDAQSGMPNTTHFLGTGVY